MQDHELGLLEHENLIATLGLVAGQTSGSVVEHRDGVALILTGHPLRLFNQVLAADADASPDAIAAAVEVARSRGDRFVLNLRAGHDDRHRATADALGLVHAGPGPWMPGMALHPVAEAAVPATDGVEIRAVADAAGVEDHIVAAAAGFEMPEEWLRAVMSERLAREPAATVYVGYDEGVPVTTGLGVRTGRTIGIYNIATVPGARRRGHGAAMTMRIVADGAAAGCDVAILQASDMGYPIYERLGFGTVVEYHGYVEPDGREPEG